MGDSSLCPPPVGKGDRGPGSLRGLLSGETIFGGQDHGKSGGAFRAGNFNVHVCGP